MKISDLVNKVEAFRFEYDGFVLEGEWYKYKTTTPRYAKEATKLLPEIPEDGTEEEQKAAQKKRNEVLEKLGHQAFADTIKSWNATNGNGEPVPPTPEVFEELPEPFVDKFFSFLKGLREGAENPTSEAS